MNRVTAPKPPQRGTRAVLPPNKAAAKATLNANARAWLAAVYRAESCPVVTRAQRDLTEALVCRELALTVLVGPTRCVLLTDAGKALARGYA